MPDTPDPIPLTFAPLLTALRDHRRVLLIGALLAVGLLLIWMALEAGRTGGWIFDDFTNLSELAGLNHDPSAYNYFQYLANGISGPSHRPLALLTFALQHNSWDHAPWDFVSVNILLHMLNATLLFWLLLRIERLRNKTGDLVPLLAALLWALAPLQPSAVLYVVQRMAVLAGTCIFGGLLLHVAGRESLRRGQAVRGYLLMSAGVATGLALGVLAKESAVVYPLLVWSLECTVLASVSRPPLWRLWSATFLGLPLALLAAYLASRLPQTMDDYATRTFTMPERLLTEGRVLWMYVGKLAIPSLSNVRVLYDDVQVSHSWLDPWTTLPALLAWIALLAAAVRQRARWPLFSLAVLWFLGSHALESTFLPLELMFDHRNYFAIAMPVWAAVAGGAALLEFSALQRVRPLLVAFAACYFIAVLAGTRSSAVLWGLPIERDQFWVLRQPNSNRAYHELAEVMLMFGMVGEADKVYQMAWQRWPDDALIILSRFELACYDAHLKVPTLENAVAAVRSAQREPLSVISMLRRMELKVSAGQCPRYSLTDMRDLIRAGLESPGLARHQVYLYFDYAAVNDQLGNHSASLDYLDKAIERWPDIELFRKAVLVSLGMDDRARARRYVESAETSPAIPFLHRWSYRREIADLRHLVDLYDSQHPPAPKPKPTHQ